MFFLEGLFLIQKHLSWPERIKWLRELVLIGTDELTVDSCFPFLLGIFSLSIMATFGIYYKFFLLLENIDFNYMLL